jgi:hypothetical protein
VRFLDRLHIPSRASDPTGSAGETYFHTGEALIRHHNGVAWGYDNEWTIPFAFSGTLAVRTGVMRVYNDSGTSWRITAARAFINTAPTGASAIFTVRENGVSAFTLTVAAAGNTITATPGTVIEVGNYITVDVTQIGSTVAGADATVVLTIAS